jgi:hypothetical protein
MGERITSRPRLHRRAFQFAALALFAVSFLFGGHANAQVVLTANSAASLVTALTTVDLHPGTSYEINITGNITLNAGTTLPAIKTTSPLIINGNNFTINGAGVQGGFFVYAGTVAINNLAIANAAAVGGNSSAGGAAGGGWARAARFLSRPAPTSPLVTSSCPAIARPAATAEDPVARAAAAVALVATEATPDAVRGAAASVVGRTGATAPAHPVRRVLSSAQPAAAQEPGVARQAASPAAAAERIKGVPADSAAAAAVASAPAGRAVMVAEAETVRREAAADSAGATPGQALL